MLTAKTARQFIEVACLLNRMHRVYQMDIGRA
jgi:hypothetical protein